MNKPTNASVVMYTTRFCPYCQAARALLKGKTVAYEDIAVDGQPALRAKMEKLSGQHTVPQIWVGDTHVGGYTDLSALDQTGQLDSLLAVQS